MRRLALAVALLAASPLARADAQAEARVLFEEGNKLVEKGNYVDALEKFRAAYARWANAKILLNIGTTLRQLGRNAEAADVYEAYLRDPGANPARVPEVQKVLADLETKIGTLRIAPSKKARVLVDGKLLGDVEGTLVARVEPGAHVIVVEPEIGKAIVLNVSVAAGETRTVEVAVAEPQTAPKPTDAPPVAAAPAPKPMPEAPPPSPRATTFGAFLRTDFEARGRGAVFAPGLTVRFADVVSINGAVLLGKQRGAEPSVSVLLLRGTFRPALVAATPAFFTSEGAAIGLRGCAGVAMDVLPSASLHAQVSYVVFVRAPEVFERSALLASLGGEVRF